MYQMMENEKECEEHKMVEKTMDKIVALAKSRGFVYPGSEIYGGLANTWDYGNLGVVSVQIRSSKISVQKKELRLKVL